MPEWIVSSKDSGKKLIVFLVERFGAQYSARALKRMLESNACEVNGHVERFASTLVGQGDHILLKIIEAPKFQPLHQFELSRILYEDEDLFIYDKPAGINSDEKGILQLLQAVYPSLQLIHRLDRDTTGALILAKTPWMREQMVQVFKEHHVEKSYLAIVDGIVTKKEGSVDNYLGKKHIYNGQTLWGAVNKQKGRHARTNWIRVKTGKEATLMICLPFTGRTHQIRVHMAEMGHPILGDFQYCKKFRCAYQPKRYLLHSYHIGFQHPKTSQYIDVEAPLPEDFNIAEEQLFN